MIFKSSRLFKRTRRTWTNGTGALEKHIERVRRETWWLFWFIPIYSRDEIVAHSL